MAINPESQYPGKISPATPQYPYGSARNVTLPGDGTGTPWEAALVNDILGWQQAILSDAGSEPTGTPEKATASQYLDAIKQVLARQSVASFASVADLKAGTAIGGATLDLAKLAAAKAVVATVAYYDGWAAATDAPLGGASYVIMTAIEYAATPDGFGDHYVGGGTDYVAKLIIRRVYDVTQFGAKGDNTRDDQPNVQATFTAALAAGTTDEQGWLPTVNFPVRNYKIGSSISISGSIVHVTCDGIARLSATEPTDSFKIFDIDTGARVTIENLTFYMFGSDNSAIGGRTWRQSTIYNCTFIGGNTGIDLADGLDVWGTTIEKCRFQDCFFGARAVVSGQTLIFRDCLFFNTRVGGWDLVLEGGSDSAQIRIESCVFESSAGADRGRSMRINNCKEVIISGTQTERLGVTSTHTGALGDYDVQITNSHVELESSRLWGGSFGSAEPGQSRQYGVYLDGNSTLKLSNSRIYSFRKVAIWSVEGSTIETDIESQVDFRCVKGSPHFKCSTDLGENHITNGDYRFTYGTGDVLPLGWNRIDKSGDQLRELVTVEEQNAAAVDFLGSSSAYWTNAVDVTPGEWITVRFIYEPTGFKEYRITTEDRTNTLFTKNISMDGGEEGNGIVVNSFKVPTGVNQVRLLFLSQTKVEGVALYRNLKVNVDAAGSLYSDNDSSFGCFVDLAPPIPFKPNKRLETFTATSTSWAGPFKNGDIVHYQDDIITSAAAIGKMYINPNFVEIGY